MTANRKPFIAPQVLSSVAMSELTLSSISGGGGFGGNDLYSPIFRRWVRWLGGWWGTSW